MTEISAPVEEAPSTLPPREDTLSSASGKRALTPPPWHPDLRLLDSRTVRNELISVAYKL